MKYKSLVFEFLWRALFVVLSGFVLPKIFTDDVFHYFRESAGVGLHHLPYRDFTWEFPPVTVLVMLVHLLPGSGFGSFAAGFVAVMIALEWSTLALLRRSVSNTAEKHSLTMYWSIVAVPLSTIAWYRLDYLSVFLGTLALLAIVSGRRAAHWIVLGTLAKLWPAVLVAALAAQRRYKSAAVSVALVVASMAAWRVLFPGGFQTFMDYRKGYGLQIESLPGALLLLSGRAVRFEYGTLVVSDHGYSFVQLLLPLLTIIGVCWTFYRMRSEPQLMVTGMATLVAIVLVTSRLVSPQYLVWLCPFSALLWSKDRRQGVLFAVTVALTLVEISIYGQILRGETWAVMVLVARNGVMLVYVSELLRLLGSGKRSIDTPRANEQLTTS